MGNASTPIIKNYGGGNMESKRIFLGTLLLVASLQATAKDNYAINLHNTSPSTVYVTNNADIADEVEVQDLEKVESVALAPRESDTIELGRNFSVYTRLPKSNYKYERHFTVGFKQEPEQDELLSVKLSDIEQNDIDDMPLLVINHLYEHAVPEAAYDLCPDGSKAKQRKGSDMYFCTLQNYDKQSDTYIETYVPIIHYVYEYLPSWVWSKWYTKNPILYHLYDKDSEYHTKLPVYQTPWSTPWYAQWYKKQPKEVTQHLERPM